MIEQKLYWPKKRKSDDDLINQFVAEAKMRGLTLQDVADRSGYNTVTIYYIVTGRRHPRLLTLQNLLEAAGLKLTLTHAEAAE